MIAPALFPPDLGRVLVKICGVTTGEQAEEIVEAGADALGVNFWSGSKRFVGLVEAKHWLAELDGVVPRVAVTVNASENELLTIAESGVVDWIQLHGDESPEWMQALLDEDVPVFKAMGIKDRDSLAAAKDFPGSTLLLDAYVPGEYGGSGQSIDWQLGAEAVSEWPDRQIVLAGGLKPENVAEAIRQVSPAAVDVASGVESEPGIKDLEKVRRFLEAVRGA